MKFLTFFSAILVAFNLASASTTPSKNCVLEPNGIESCSNGVSNLPTMMRQSVPCEKDDMECWCMKAVEYTNDIRRSRGKKDLKVGTVRQLDNVVRYAAKLGDMGYLQHQSLSDATLDVGCGRYIGGENIAYNYDGGDVAKACMDQWEGSSGHLENILRDTFVEVAVGVHFESDGRVYCVQTFTSSEVWGDTTGSPSDKGCEPVRDASKPKPTKQAPTKPTSTKLPKPTEKPTVPAKQQGPGPGAPMKNQAMKDQSNRSCRCIELGKKCWHSLRALSGNRCKSFTPATKQPKRCKKRCCIYCKHYPNTPPCRSRRVKRVCRKLY